MTGTLRKKLYLFSILLGLIRPIALAQTSVKLDSLLNRLKTAAPDTNKVNLLRNIVKILQPNNTSVVYAKQELALATKLNWPKGRVRALLSLGWLAFRKSDFAGIVVYDQQAYEIAKANGDFELLNTTLAPLGLAYRLTGNLTAAVKYFSADYENKKNLTGKKLPGQITEFKWEYPAWQLCMSYHQQKNDVKALGFLGSLLQKFKNQKNEDAFLVVQHLIASYQMNLKHDYPAAIAEFQGVLKLFKTGDTSDDRAAVFLELADCCLYLSKYQEALDYKKKECAISYRNDKLAAQKAINEFIGEIYAAMDDYEEALKFDLSRYQEGNKNTKTLMTLSFECNSVTNDYLHLKSYDKALHYALQGFNMLEKTDDEWDKGYAALALAKTYYALKDYPNTFKIVTLATAIKGQDETNKYSNYYLLGMFCNNAPDTVLLENRIKPTDRHMLAAKNLNLALAGAVKDNDITLQRDCYKALSEVYDQQRNYKLFYANYKPYVALKDSIANNHDQTQINRQQLQVQFVKREDSLKFQQKLTNQKAKQQTYYYLSGLAFLLILSFFITRNYINQRKANKLITAEKHRSDELLLNILPADIAEELKEKGSSEARFFDEVTVLFTDFVSFTTVSELLSPQKLVNELNVCFKAFDEIMTTHNIEKIKTVGDAYLAVSGLPNADPGHAANIIYAAQEIQHFMLERKLRMGDQTFGIRIGIHSGSVVAGIVGVKKFAYDIWGDTVNTAARMEQNSEPGKINVSEKTYELVKNQFTFTYRGEIEAKNKGALKMFYIEQSTSKMTM